jgi:RNA polymerase sigma-70 factor (ECF subfamily)
VKDPDLTYQREVVDAFLAASRAGNFDALLAVLDPDVVFRADRTLVAAGASREVRGAPFVAQQFSGRALGARPALVNGAVGLVVARHGRLFLVLNLTIRHGKIVGIDAVADPTHLHQLRLSVLDD